MGGLTKFRHHLANQVNAERLLYLFSSVSSPISIVEFFWSNGVVVMLLIEEAKAVSLLKLLLFVVIGLALLENILPSFKAEFEVTDSPSGGGLGPEGIENSGLFSRLSSSRGKPRPALAQLTSDKRPLKASATGETKLSG